MSLPARHRALVKQLSTAQKSNRGAAGYSRWVNRPLGRQLAAGAHLAGLSPNQISTLSAVFTYTSIALMASVAPTWPSSITVVLLLVIGYALDSADGQVARLRGGGSPAGEWLDHVFDAVKLATFHLAVAICWFRYFDLKRPAAILIPLTYSAVATVFFFAITLADMLRRIERLRAGGTGVTTASVNPDERAPILRSLVVLPNDYGVLCLTMMLLPLHTTFTIVYTVLLAANVVFLGVGCVRWFREMQTL